MTAQRILFLDDDPERAQIFQGMYPQAHWVQTVEDCVDHLDRPWDLVYLDHDLGGEKFVDLSRDDCGMAVVRWLTQTQRPHLKQTRFIVHSHNSQAAQIMVMQLEASGYRADATPFTLLTLIRDRPNRTPWDRLRSWLSGPR